MEGREIREKRAKGTLKRDADEINEDESEIGSEEESKAESEINPSLQKESSLPAESKGMKRKQTKRSISAVRRRDKGYAVIMTTIDLNYL